MVLVAGSYQNCLVGNNVEFQDDPNTDLPSVSGNGDGYTGAPIQGVYYALDNNITCLTELGVVTNIVGILRVDDGGIKFFQGCREVNGIDISPNEINNLDANSSVVSIPSLNLDFTPSPDVPAANPPPAGAAFPILQNGIGGSGAPISSGVQQQMSMYQPDFDTDTVPANITATNVDSPHSIGAYSDPNDGDKIKFFVVDKGRHRILAYDSVPTNANATPSLVIGQSDFTSGELDAGAGGTNASGVDAPTHVSVCTDGTLFIADQNNHRILGYNQIPTANGAAADFVIGQTDFTSFAEGNGATELNFPNAVHCIDEKLFVVDEGNNRVLIYNTIPKANNAAADVVIGQQGFGTGAPGCSASSLNLPFELLLDKGKLYLADGTNGRVLIFNSIPTTNGASADAVLGQPDMNSCAKNRGLATGSANSFSEPNGLAIQDDVLAVSDFENNRINFFNLPIVGDQSAFAQVGQPNFQETAHLSPPSVNSIGCPKSIIFDDGFIWVGEESSNRVSAFPLPY